MQEQGCEGRCGGCFFGPAAGLAATSLPAERVVVAVGLGGRARRARREIGVVVGLARGQEGGDDAGGVVGTPAGPAVARVAGGRGAREVLLFRRQERLGSENGGSFLLLYSRDGGVVWRR